MCSTSSTIPVLSLRQLQRSSLCDTMTRPALLAQQNRNEKHVLKTMSHLPDHNYNPDHRMHNTALCTRNTHK
jgi:hypothetical protein